MREDQRRIAEERSRDDAGKTINICRNDEITKLQQKKMSNYKKVNGISNKKLRKISKQKNKWENQIKWLRVVRKMNQIEVMMARNVNSEGKFTN